MTTLLIVLVAVLSLPSRAQDEAADDKSFLETWLETNLSSAGRDVRITGFAGALSAQATIEELTIADDDGVWLTLRGIQLDWTRSALFSGRLEIDTLLSDEIEISRRPLPGPDQPQTASTFSLPELPVSISIGKIEVSRIVLGEAVLGVAAQMRLEGAGQLEDGAGQVNLLVERIDGAKGVLRMAGSYANDTRNLMLRLSLSEGANGIVATLTGLPGGAPIAMTIAGEGPIEGFAADIGLATDGVTRLSGRIELTADAATSDAALGFRADLIGNPSPLFAPDYARFFGNDVRLTLAGQKHPDGYLDITSFQIRTNAMNFSGAARINPFGWVERAHVSGTIAASDGEPVLLPISGAPTRLDKAQVQFDFDSTQGAGWTGAFSLLGLSRDDLSIASALLSGAGTLAPGANGQVAQITGQLDISATGIAPTDSALATAIGPDITGRLDFSKRDGARVRLTNIVLSGADYGVSGKVSFGADLPRFDLLTTSDLAFRADDLTRFSGIAGRPITGAAQLQITGAAALPRGPFDLIVDGIGQDLAIGMEWFDRLFAGDSSLSFEAVRGATGTRIEQFSIIATGASAQATATLAPDGSQIAARIDVADAGLLFDGLDGELSLNGTAQQAEDDWQVDLNATAPGAISAQLAGVITTERDGIALVQGEVNATIGTLAPYSGLAGRHLTGGATIAIQGRFEPANGAVTLDGSLQGNDLSFGLGAFDKLTAGKSRAAFTVQRDSDGVLRIDHLDLATAQITVQATSADADGQQVLQAQVSLRDLGLIVPGLSGPFTAKGNATLSDTTWQVSVEGAGPGGTDLTTTGHIASDGSQANLTLTGHAPLALANPFIAPRQVDGLAAFDLSLNGGFTLASLSGTVRTENARIALPSQRISFDPVVATVRISDRQARLEASAAISSGGQIAVSGPVSLIAPYVGNLTLRLDAVGLTDPTLYDTVANGTITVNGPLMNGARISGTISLGAVELRVPETGYGVDGSLPGLTHIAQPAAVAATRARAGQSNSQSDSGSGASYALDLIISAPDRVFLRGRGLDAELGGTLRLGGTTQQIAAQGGFQLIRGRLDLLGNRLVLTEGTATLQGSLEPFIRLVAETQTDDATILITVEGLASGPDVTFTSSPELPEDEILARLVFGRGLKQISPFQALKLASAVATLSGKRGAGTISRLRTGFGLDDLDVTTDDDGAVSVRAGAYISDNIYSDATVGADGKSEINLNISINPNATLRGQVSTDGNTGIGIFFEMDY